MNEIEKEILEKIRPTLQERKKINQLVDNCTNELETRIKEKELQAEVVLTGSIAKDTWISGDKNIDIFVIFPHDYSEAQLKKYGLEIGKLFTHEIAYAEHPYVRNLHDGYEIDVVPAYKFREGIRSSVDRTPLHTEYVLTHLQDKDQVRLLKKFTRSIGVYGSDLKMQGFSGYLCELLVIRYGTFRKVLEAADTWKVKDPLYLEEAPTKKFREPFVFIDPVDVGRNVAAVVSLENFTKFIHYSREYVRTNGPSYFFREPERYNRYTGTKLFCIDFHVDVIDDILFPQLRKTRDFLVKKLEKNGFSVFNSAVFDSGILLELSVFELPPFKKHVGPPISEREHCDRFLEKHELAGFQDDRVYAIVKRKYVTAHDMLEALLAHRQGFGKDLMKAESELSEVTGDTDVIIY
jgi:tRNA nucleotidyltransferase (CCA-adding enzyme)